MYRFVPDSCQHLVVGRTAFEKWLGQDPRNILSANFSTAHLESLEILDIAAKMLKYYFTESI